MMSLDEIIRQSVTSLKFVLYDFNDIKVTANFTLSGVLIESEVNTKVKHLYGKKFLEEISRKMFLNPVEAAELLEGAISIKYSDDFTFEVGMVGTVVEEVIKMRKQLKISFNVSNKSDNVKLKLKDHSALIKPEEVFISNGDFSLVLDFDSISKIYYEFRKIRNK